VIQVRRTIAIAVLAAAVAAGALLPGRTFAPRVRNVEFQAVTDVSDDRRLVGLAHDVFVGDVLEQTGQIEEPIVETQFSVRVISAIKGSLSGVATVNQQGGLFRGRREAIVLEGDTLLQPGKRYLFATRTNPETGWHTLVPQYGDIEVRGAAEQAALTARFAGAALAEIHFDPREVG
jgi:hypothetical protein